MLSEDEKSITANLQNQMTRAKKGLRGSPSAIAQQRDTLKRFIELVACPYSSIKITVARNIQLYINDFPELEEDAINAVYDLCEDQDSQVRIEGYKAITSVSRVQGKWVKRNADVLVQLLQSDEPAEVLVVEKQLIAHLDMDPTVTVNVLCDQVIPSDPVDEEDQATRDRLRSLVLQFMRTRARQGLVRRAVANDNEPERALVSRVLNAFGRFGSSDLDILVEDIILFLPSYTTKSPQAAELLTAIISEAEQAYKEFDDKVNAQRDKGMVKAQTQVSLQRVRHLLGLANFVAVQKSLASPTIIIDFWLPNKLNQRGLGRLDQDMQFFALDSIVSAFQSIQDSKDSQTVDIVANVRTKLIEACSSVIPWFVAVQSTAVNDKPWSAFKCFLNAYVTHLNATPSGLPSKLVPVIQRLKFQVEEAQKSVTPSNKTILEEVQGLTVSLQAFYPTKTSPSNVQGMSSDTRKINGGPVQINRNFGDNTSESPAHQRARAVLAASERPRSHDHKPATSGSRAGLSRQDTVPLIQAPPTRSRNSEVISTAQSNLRRMPSQDAGPPVAGRNRLKPEASVPTLLSRMALATANDSKAPASVPAKRPAESESATLKRPRTQSNTSAVAAPEGGFSIKGAARRQSPDSVPLLDRLGSGNGGSHEGESGRSQGKKRRIKT